MEGGTKVVCPWICLGGNNKDEAATTKQTATNCKEQRKKLSYADIAKDRLERSVSIAALPVPSMRGETPVIRVPGKSLHKGLDYLKFSLVTRIESNGRRIEDLKAGIADRWADMSAKISPLGKGYFLARFDTEAGYNKVKFGGPWFYGKQVLRVSDWSPNFNVERQTHSNAMIWVKFPGLSLEYWELDILMSMARTVGSPVHVDRNTLKRDNGFYANVLVDVDLAKPVPSRILVEVEDTDIQFWQEIQLGPLPNFCNVCKVVGHQATDCRLLVVPPQKESIVNAKVSGQVHTLKVANESKRKLRRDRRKEKENNIDEVLNIEANSDSENEQQDVEEPQLKEDNGNAKSQLEEVCEVLQVSGNEAIIQDMAVNQSLIRNEGIGLAKSRPHESQEGAVMISSTQQVEENVAHEVGHVQVIEETEMNVEPLLLVENVQGIEEIAEGRPVVPILIVVGDTGEQTQEIGDEQQYAQEENMDHFIEVSNNSAVNEVLGLPETVLDSKLVLSDEEEVVPESQIQLVKEAGIVQELLDGISRQNNHGSIRDVSSRKLVAKISKKKIALLPPGPMKERLIAMSPNE